MIVSWFSCSSYPVIEKMFTDTSEHRGAAQYEQQRISNTSFSAYVYSQIRLFETRTLIHFVRVLLISSACAPSRLASIELECAI